MLYGKNFDANYEFLPENADVSAEISDVLKRDEGTSRTESLSCATRWSGLFRQTAKQGGRIQKTQDFFQSENESIIGDELDYCPTQLVKVDGQLFEAMEEESGDESSSEEISSTECTEILKQVLKVTETDIIDAELVGKFVRINGKQLNDCVLEDERLLSEDNLTDGIVIRLCEDLTSSEHQLSLAWSVTFVDLFVRKKIKFCRMAPSRALMTAVSKFSEKFPRAIVDGLMIPCITDLNCSRIQMDVIKHLFVQNTSHQHQDMFLKKFCEQCFVWTESVVTFLSVCVEMRSDVIYEDVLDSLISRISDCTQNLDSSLTFSKFLNVIVTKLRARLSSVNVAQLTDVVNKNKTFLKKSCLSKLQSING